MRFRWIFGSIAAALLHFAPTPSRAQDLVLDARSGPFVDAWINGVRLRLKVELDHAGAVTLNPAAAARTGLGRGQGKWVDIIGPVRLSGRFARAPLVVQGREVSAKIHWQERNVTSEADGTVTPHLLPFDTVTLIRRQESGSERELVFGARMDENHGIHFPLRIGKRRVAVRFSFFRPRSFALAAAAAVIAENHGGVLEEGRSFESISYGVDRPVRPLRLSRPLEVGSLTLSRMMARTVDFRGKHKLARAPAREDGILVVGRIPSQDAVYRLTLGLDVLDRCSRAVYTRSTGELRLRCAPG